jgi:hypothetical protein
MSRDGRGPYCGTDVMVIYAASAIRYPEALAACAFDSRPYRLGPLRASIDLVGEKGRQLWHQCNVREHRLSWNRAT